MGASHPVRQKEQNELKCKRPFCFALEQFIQGDKNHKDRDRKQKLVMFVLMIYSHLSFSFNYDICNNFAFPCPLADGCVARTEEKNKENNESVDSFASKTSPALALNESDALTAKTKEHKEYQNSTQYREKIKHLLGKREETKSKINVLKIISILVSLKNYSEP